MKTFRTAISPLLIVLCLCGLGVFERRDRPRLRHTVLYILVLWLLIIYVIVAVQIFLRRFAIVLPMGVTTSVAFAVLYILCNLFHNKVHEDNRNFGIGKKIGDCN